MIFGGDTALTNDFAELHDGRAYDLAIMGVGAYQPWIRVHCTPEQATAMASAAGVMRFVTPMVVGHPPSPDMAAFWGFAALGLFVGAVLTYPVNLWMVRIGWKHGMA